MMRARVSVPIRSGELKAREAVDSDTPARSATCVSVGATGHSFDLV
jgi:hypothetical protein